MYAFLADVHLCTKLEMKDHISSLNYLFKIIKEHKEECHGIFITGDLFDHRLNINELKAVVPYLIMLACNKCGENGKNVPVYFVHGTFSHDNEQYEIFLPLLQKLPDVEIHYVKHVCDSQTHYNHAILFLPQEYGDIDYSQFINDNKHYHLIVGHGPISSEKNSPCKVTGYEICHSVEQLGKISDLCVFGHYHDYTDFGNGVYYVGANLRWRYGEDEDCVFFICDDKFKVTTIKNPYAKEYKTIKVSSPEELREYLNEASSDESQLRFVISSSDKEELGTYNGIINNNKRNTQVSFIVSSTNEEDNDEEIQDLTMDIDSNNNHGLDPVQSLLTYIKDKYNTDASDKVMEYASRINRDIEDES